MRSKNIEPYFFILPTVILFFLVLFVPLINLIQFSLGDSNIIEGYTGWNNFENYKYLLTKPFLKTVSVTVIWLVGSIVGMITCGIIMALVLDKPIRGRGFFRSIIIIPWIIPHVFAGAIWGWVVNPQFGLLNQSLLKLNLIAQPISFLSPKLALITVIIVRIWQGTPFVIMTMLAALQTIPSEVEEAASLDGAAGFTKFRFITLPHIAPVLSVTTLILSAWTLQIFDVIYVMTGGGPVRATRTVAIETFMRAFAERDLGSASVVAIFTMILIIILSVFQIKYSEDNRLK